MAQLIRAEPANSVKDESVQNKTGKTWDEWFKLLDKSGARMMDHAEMLEYLRGHDLTPWWCKTVAVSYQQARGLRQKYQRGSFFHIKRSAIVKAALGPVWTACQETDALRRWLPGDGFEIARAEPQRVLHLNWPDESRVIIEFSEKNGRCRVIASHEKVRDSNEVARLKTYWEQALSQLRNLVEGS